MIAKPAIEVLGRDFDFPVRIDGLPEKLSDFNDLKIGSFVTNDRVELSYWEAGEGAPVVFIPGWNANGAMYVNLLYLLAKHYHVYVLDPRNQGLSQRVEHGRRIARFSKDLEDFRTHLALASADYVGWSMGAAVLWGFIDLFGTGNIRKTVFIDEPISIYAHSDWSTKEREDAGGITRSPERFVVSFTAGAEDSLELARGFPAFFNSESFAKQFISSDMASLRRVLFDHVTNDWRDVVQHKLDVPTAIFTGEQSTVLASQRWAHWVIDGSSLYVYTVAEHGDHSLMFKNPFKFAQDLGSFLGQ
jgi:pimeloyl-ACP methyl ester carboxylesterase